MSVSQYYYRLGDDAVGQYRHYRASFRLEDYLDTESFQMYGEECLLVDDLAAQAMTGPSEKELLSGAVSGFAGASVYGTGDSPFLIERGTVAAASRLLDEIRAEDLRRACDLDRLKAQYLEVQVWLWESWGPNGFEERLLPKFELIRGLYRRAAERHQHVIVGWF